MRISSPQRSFRLLLLLPAISLLGQSSPAQQAVTGTILDGNSRRPMEYVNVLLYLSDDSSFVTGTSTGSRGEFEIPDVESGSYYLDLRFMGYDAKRVGNLTVADVPVGIGEVFLQPSSIGMDEVLVEGARPAFSYRIDKKVVDVDQFTTTMSGTASDVLKNVPSVSVDIEGNVSLRGSGNFTVLVDGKPSILDALDVLRQIPASMIDEIEIITNPSAKYDPEGSAGIINIVMKEQQETGWSGMVNANLGLNEKYGGDVLFERKEGSVSYVLGLDYRNTLYPGSSSAEEQYVYQDTASFIQSVGDMETFRNNLGVRGEIDFSIGRHGSLRFAGRYGTRDWQRNGSLQYSEWSVPSSAQLSGTNVLRRGRGGNFSGLDAGYRHTLGPNGHVLSVDLMFRYRDSDELTTSELFEGGILVEGKRTTEIGPSRDLSTRVEYVLPVGESGKFEAGYHGDLDLAKEETGIADYDPALGNYVVLPEFNRNVEYRDAKHALYSMIGGEAGSFGYQLGLRGEYMDRLIRLADGNEYLVDRPDLFPTIHSSFEFAEQSQVMASYTRRIDRPRGWELEPFETWIDANNLRRGNPSLLPEYIDSYEAGVHGLLGGISASVELYHRLTHNKIEHVRSVYDENVTLTTIENVGKERSTGAELLLTFDPVGDWNVNLIGNAYDYRVEGTLFDEPFSAQSFNWSARMNNTASLGPTTQVQLNAIWNSPTVSPQGRREGFFSMDVALRQDFWNRQLALILQVENVLNTARHESASEGPGFSSYNYYKMESPVVMLTVRLSINGYAPESEGGREGGFGQDDF